MMDVLSGRGVQGSIHPLNAPHNLSFTQATIYATILEDALTQLRILVECNNEIKIYKTKSDLPKLLKAKYGVLQPLLIDDIAEIDTRKLQCMEYKINKLEADKKYLVKVIKSVYLDLVKSQDFRSLLGHINERIDYEQYREDLRVAEGKNNSYKQEVYKQLRQQRNHNKTILYDVDGLISGLNTQVENSGLIAAVRNRYIQSWQLARTEQHLQTIANVEAKPSRQIENYKRRSDHENRVHAEVELLVTIAINETLDEVEKWMQKYDDDMENIDLKIQFKKNDYQNMLEKRIELEKTIEIHEVQMKDWTQFKEARENARKYREKMTNSAIIVQAWWRGLLVRLQLGPYKVAKKKKGVGKKK